jgi:hypothetical protein
VSKQQAQIDRQDEALEAILLQIVPLIGEKLTDLEARVRALETADAPAA